MLQRGNDKVAGELTALRQAQDEYTSAIDYDGTGNPIYIGLAAQGSAKGAAVWQIRKITYDGSSNPTDIQFANGTKAFTAIWDNRASLSYS